MNVIGADRIVEKMQLSHPGLTKEDRVAGQLERAWRARQWHSIAIVRILDSDRLARGANPLPDRVANHFGPQAWYICLALPFIGTALLISREFSRKGFDVHESIIVLTLGLLLGVIIRLTGDSALKDIALFDQNVFVFLLLPIIIFESGFGMENKGIFFRNFGTIFTFAFGGTILSTVIIGSVLALLTTGTHSFAVLTPSECFAAGAILSAVDPVASLAIFVKKRVDPELRTIIYGEAVVNDAVAIVLFRLFTAGGGSSTTDFWGVIGGCFLAILALVGASLIGFAVMAVAAAILRRVGTQTGLQRVAGSLRLSSSRFSFVAFALAGARPQRHRIVLRRNLCCSLHANEYAIEGTCHFSWQSGKSLRFLYTKSGNRSQYISQAVPGTSLLHCRGPRHLEPWIAIPVFSACLTVGGRRTPTRRHHNMWHAGSRSHCWPLL